MQNQENKSNTPGKSRLVFISPWLLAAATALLAVIIAIFAATNLRIEKKYLTENLLRKGEDIIRFIHASARITMRNDIGDLAGQVQHFAEQAVEDQGVLYIIIIDEKGAAVIHSKTELIGATIDRAPAFIDSISMDKTPRWQIIDANKSRPGKIFEVAGQYRPNFLRGRPMHRHRMMQDDDESPPPPFFKEDRHFVILVGLDATDYLASIRGQKIQILIMSIVLLLVGAGGWLSLLTAQSYKISQEALGRVQAFARLLISKLPVGIIAMDHKGIINTFNQTAATIFEIPVDDAIRKSPNAVLPTDIATLLESEKKSTTGSSEKDMSYTNSSGRVFELRLSAVPVISADNSKMGSVLLIHDLTDIKKLERDVRRQERFAALGKMAAGVAHEVRNPLSSIKGFAVLLGKKIPTGAKEENVSRLLINEVERLDRSISELLNYTKPLPLNLARIDVSALLDNSIELIRSDAEELGVRVTTRIEPGARQILADRDKLNQVLLNLYLNALQAMESGGELEISCENQLDKAAILITVKDNGCGIPKESIGKIFDPYFTAKQNGTGLGLAMVQKIIDEHGGSVTVKSQVGIGTEISVTLPDTIEES